MIEVFKRVLWDASAFERYARALLFAAAGVAATGGLDDVLPKWATAVFLALGGLIGAGEKNQQ